MRNTTLYPCEELPTENSVVNIDQVNRVLSEFFIIKYLGKGGSSIVVEVHPPNDNTTALAVKVMLLSDRSSINDLEIACQLNGLQKLTPFFIYTHGWFMVDGIPEIWRDTLEDYPNRYDNNTLLCQMMDKSAYNFNDDTVRLTEPEYKQVLYIMLHGIELAKTKYGFKHGDLHAGQILLNVNRNEQLTISNTVIQMGRFCPKLIDFGFSTTDLHPERSFHSFSQSFSTDSGENVSFSKDSDDEEISYRIQEDDTDKLISIVHAKMDQQLHKKKRSHNQFFTNRSLKDFEQYAETRNDSYFDSIIIKREVEPLNHHCMVCHGEATLKWKNTGYTFCSKKCSNYWEPLRGIVWQNSAHSY
jgi:serine/threonine protein kinase